MYIFVPAARQLPDDIVLHLAGHFPPLLAASICRAARIVVLTAHSCASIGELKIALAMERQTCLHDRVVMVNTAINHGMKCNLYLGPLLQPFYHGPRVPSDAYNVVAEPRNDRSYYGPSQLTSVYCNDMNSSVYVVPLERSVALVQQPPDNAMLSMSLSSIHGNYEPSLKIYEYMNLNGRLPNNLHRPIQLKHCGDHCTVAMAHFPDVYSSRIVRRTLDQQHICWHAHKPWWQCMTYVTIRPMTPTYA